MTCDGVGFRGPDVTAADPGCDGLVGKPELILRLRDFRCPPADPIWSRQQLFDRCVQIYRHRNKLPVQSPVIPSLTSTERV